MPKRPFPEIQSQGRPLIQKDPGSGSEDLHREQNLSFPTLEVLRHTAFLDPVIGEGTGGPRGALQSLSQKKGRVLESCFASFSPE